MKRALSMILAVMMIFLLCSCGGGGSAEVPENTPIDKTKAAFDASSDAYQNINAAYEIVEKMGNDIYEAWRAGIYDDDEIIDDGYSYLAGELNLTEDELREGGAYTLSQAFEQDWDTLTEEEKEENRTGAEALFAIFEDDLFSICVMVTKAAYTVNGQADEAKEYLDAAKTQMRDMSANYSDYEHYPALKGYYTTTSSFFDFCQNPQGSFEQIKTTVEDYRSEARDYKADLDYIFED